MDSSGTRHIRRHLPEKGEIILMTAEYRVRRESLMKAIEKIENGAQEYRIGNRTVRRADLASLYAELERVEAKLSQLERPSITAAVLPRRR